MAVDASLNKPQQIAVQHRQGPLLVLAGAGTGKTRVITFRIAALIRHGVRADRILGVTFTNKAAHEMQERLTKILGRKAKQKPLIATFHSLCVRILRRQITRLGYPERFAIYSSGEQEGVARSVLREINVAESVIAPNQLVFQISNWKNQNLSPDEAQSVADTDRLMVAAIGYRRYQQALKKLGAVDFDDLLLLTEKLFRQFPEVRTEESQRFDHLLVDEYQDTNQTQYSIVAALARDHQNLCVVGDDDQSIYGWRGAQVEHILRFKQQWPAAVTVRLEDNYRSTQAIVELANNLIQHNKLRHDKVLIASRRGGDPPKVVQYPDEAKEALETVNSIKQRIQTAHREPRDFAILFRTNEQTRAFETELRKAKLPYILIGGMSFFDRKEVQDILAYLRLVDSPADDVAALRIMNRPPRGLGKKAIEELVATSQKHKKSIWEIATTPELRPEKLPVAAAQGLDRLANAYDQFRQAGSKAKLVDAVMAFIERVDYRQEIDRLYPEPDDRETRWNAVQQIINGLSQYELQTDEPKLTEFLDQMLLGDREMDDDKEKQLKKNAIVLMTLHAAKGLEFPEVYLVGMIEGLLPHHRALSENEQAIDEERRLCYVGITRAQDRLTLSLPLGRMKWGKSRPTQPSRFLYELLNKTDHPNYAVAIKGAIS